VTSRPAAEQTPATTAGALPAATSNPGDAHDLRALLAVVLDALTLPYDTARYDQRLTERAMWARTAVKGALEEDPADVGWNADWLRSRLRAEEAEAADRAVRASVDRAFPVVAAFLADERARGEQR
jgi:hypothetical protein